MASTIRFKGLPAFLVPALVGLWIGMPPPPAAAQFLRLGVFDISPSANLQFIYTTNVEGERKSEATDDREDFYVVLGLGFTADADLTDKWSLGTEFGVEFERHFIRDDLDSDSVDDFFGLLKFNNVVNSGHYTFLLDSSYERKREVDDEEFVSGSLKTRDPHSVWDTTVGLNWERLEYAWGVSYQHIEERHDDEEFQDGDQDEDNVNLFFDYKVNSRVTLSYDYERTRTELLNQPDAPGSGEWETTQLIELKFILIRERPKLTYGLGLEKEDDVDQKGEWELVHNFDLTYETDLTDVLRLSASANYSIEQEEEADDIGFTYRVQLDHDVSSTVSQSLSLSKEPASTFGSTQDTDSTEVAYKFNKSSLFIRELAFNAGVTYTRDEPPGPDAVVEKNWKYEAGLTHERTVTRRISRIIRYDYTREDLNTEKEILEEHRVTWEYDYSFD